MTTRRARFERQAMQEERLEKRREERQFVRDLEKARETLGSVIEQAERGSVLAFGTLEDFSEQMNGIYAQADRLEDNER